MRLIEKYTTTENVSFSIGRLIFLWAFDVVLVRRATAATATITLARLFVEMMCYVLRRLHSSCVLRPTCTE